MKGQSKSQLTTTIEFIPETHTYLYQGIEIPSVSELIRFRFPEAYANIPEKILKRKASYGTKVHDYIERFINGEFTLEELSQKRIDPDIKIAVEQFEILRKMWAFQIKDMERIVSWDGRYAGMFDLLTLDDYVIDIKTTTECKEDLLRYQISLYYKALGIKRDFGFCMWFPKGKMGKVIQINTIPDKELTSLIDEYEKAHPPA